MVNKLLTYAIVVILIIASISIICKNCQATALVKRMSAEQGVKKLPAKLNKFGGTAQLTSNESVSLDEAYNSGYSSGYDAGDDATNAVYSSGYEQGIHNAMSDEYRSGYEHGVQDGKTGTIREDFANHTAKYDQGWVDGYCSIAGEGAGSDSDKGTFECSLDTTQFKGTNTIPAWIYRWKA
ncbi:MAG TPA: hypothetical protein VN922_00055 [Bacteroidia bacterium]|nr:hypothetical protein [Bacteroidia bacterium]